MGEEMAGLECGRITAGIARNEAAEERTRRGKGGDGDGAWLERLGGRERVGSQDPGRVVFRVFEHLLERGEEAGWLVRKAGGENRSPCLRSIGVVERVQRWRV